MQAVMPGRYDLVVSMASLQVTPKLHFTVLIKFCNTLVNKFSSVVMYDFGSHIYDNGACMGIIEKHSKGDGPLPLWPADSRGKAVWDNFRLPVTVEGTVPRNLHITFVSWDRNEVLNPGVLLDGANLTLVRVISNAALSSVDTT
jgi:hypothetical protein